MILKIQKKIKNSFLQIVKDLRKSRDAKFMFFSPSLTISNLMNILACENLGKFVAADTILIEATITYLISKKILHPACVKYSNYKFKTITYHDVYLKTTENAFFCRGTSTDIGEAYAKAFGEVFERTSTKYGNGEELVKKKLSEVKNDSRYLDFNLVAKPTQKQLEKFPEFKITDTDEFKFIKVKKISDNSDIYIPAQTVFYGSFLDSNKLREKKILQPTTNGSGAGFSRSDAFKSCFFEIVHRHYFFKHWWGHTSPKKLDTETIPKNSSLDIKVKEFQARGFTVNFLDFSNEAGIPTFICIIEKYGSWSCGGSTNVTSEKALGRALDEAFATYLWLMQSDIERGNQIEQKLVAEISEDFLDEKAEPATKMFLFDNSHFMKDFDKFILSGEKSKFTTEFDLEKEYENLDNLYKLAVAKFGPNIFHHQQYKNYLEDFDYFVAKVYVPNSYYFALSEIMNRPILNDGIQPIFTKISPFP